MKILTDIELANFPLISMWRPWCFFVSQGWKTIETRTHDRFKSLLGKTIGIHSAQKWDNNWLFEAFDYLTESQIEKTTQIGRDGGEIICTAFVSDVRWLSGKDSMAACINCRNKKRYGIILTDIEPIKPIRCRGRQGIFYCK